MSTRSELRALTVAMGRLNDDIRDLRNEQRAGFANVNGRIDAMHTRVDTMIDTVAGLRTDYDRHTHPDGGPPV